MFFSGIKVVLSLGNEFEGVPPQALKVILKLGKDEHIIGIITGATDGGVLKDFQFVVGTIKK